MSLLELLLYLEAELGVKLNPSRLPWRANDQKYFVADNSKAARMLAWNPGKSKQEGIADALSWEKARR
jgi:CDP-paratose 2-epimerase